MVGNVAVGWQSRAGGVGRGPGQRVAGRRRRPRAIIPLLLALLPLALPTGGSLAAQQDTARARPTADTVPADTVLSARERALERLRGMSRTAVEADTLAGDTAAADTAAADTADEGDEGDEAGARRRPELPPGLEMQEERAAEGEGRARPRPPAVDAAGDTLVLFDPEGPPGRDAMLEADSVLALLRSLEGYSVTEYRGEGAVFQSETEQLELTGTSQVGQGQNQLETDSLLVYDGRTGIVCGYGQPVLSGDRDPIRSREVCFDIEQNMGLAVGAETRFQQGATWYVRGAENRIYLLTGEDRNTLYGQGAEFTSCELDHPHYLFHARSLKMIEDDMMVARDITLRFDDVPVFWLPWMVQSMKRDRRSGLLMPQFGVNDIVRNSSSYNRHLSNLGFYWAINDYASARGTFEWYSGNWTAVEGALTYRWLRQFLRGSLTTKQYWREGGDFGAGRRELTLNTSNSWQPDERTRVQLNANYATSTEFVRDNSFDPNELNRKITSSASVNRSFRWGSMSVGADRNEQISTGQVDMKLPGVSLSISPVTLFELGEGRGATWNGSGNFTRRTRTMPDSLGRPDQDTRDAGYSHSFSLGRVGLSQRVSWREQVETGPIGPTAVEGVPGGLLTPGPHQVVDELGSTGFGMARLSDASLGWSNSLSFQQVLWPGTTVSPSVSMTGNQVRDERTDGEFVAEPNRVSAGASLNTAVYGFWPGFGPYSRIRHKISPTMRWAYSPAPEVTARQEEIFGATNLREQNRITFSFNQTFEAKVRETETEAGESPGGEGPVGGAGRPDGQDRAGDDAPETQDEQATADGEPRRLPRTQTVMLLALDTRTSFQYDFVAAREDGRGFLTDQIQNSIRSDVLRGLQVSTTHSLFETEPAPRGELAPRRFAPYLTDLSASFSIDNEFWLFELLGLTSEADGPGTDAAPDTVGDFDADAIDMDELAAGAEATGDRSGGPGAMIGGRGTDAPGAAPGVGGWRASVNYSLRRSRPGAATGPDNQIVSGNLSFQPTEHWSVRWNTSYSITDREFANHTLTLSRDLHRWQANFDFMKAQNGNFSMQFRVQLRDNPDLKLDYDQRTNAAQSRGGRGGGPRAPR